MAAVKGQSMAETAIVLPLILLILFAMISVGLYIYDLTVFTMASNKGLDARIGAVANSEITDKDIAAEEKAKDFAEVAVFVEDIKVSSTDDQDNNMITVTVEGEFRCILPFINEIFKENFHLKSVCSYIYNEEI